MTLTTLAEVLALLNDAKKISAATATTILPQTASYPVALVGDTTARRITHATLRGGVFNVKDYGAVGDGTHNDAPNIQAAINAAQSAGGGEITFPLGRFRLESGLTSYRNINFSGVGGQSYSSSFGSADFQGTAYKGTILEYTPATGAALTINSGYEPVHMRGLVFKGLGNNSATNTGISLSTAAHCVWSGVCIANFQTGLETTSVFECVFERLTFRGCHVGLNAVVDLNSNTFIQICAAACDTGLLFTSAVNNLVAGGAIQANRDIGIDFVGGTGNVFDTLYFESNVNYAIYHRFPCTNNVFRNIHGGTAGDKVYIAGNGNYFGAGDTIAGGFILDGSAVFNTLDVNASAQVTGGDRAWNAVRYFDTSPASDGLAWYISQGLIVGGTLGHRGNNLGFYNIAPVARQTLATGSGKLVDDVITILQNLGLVKQS